MAPETVHAVARLAALGFALTLVQVTAVSQLELFGTNADLLPLVVAAVGLLLGSVHGATFGFAVGLLTDTMYFQTLGLSSLVYTVAGYLAGRVREAADPQGAIVPVAVGAAATAVALVGFGLMNFLLGIDAPVSWLLVRQILVTVLLNALLAAPVLALTRKVLLPVLPEDPRRRRRRASTTSLSPLMTSRSVVRR
jgi:rod shape-determining protein MreD